MKQHLIICSLLLASVIFFGCEGGNVEHKKTPYRLRHIPITIATIDSCEYIIVNAGYATWGSHKGNCKFCMERER